jgi:hypothetical protein
MHFSAEHSKSSGAASGRYTNIQPNLFDEYRR